MTIRERISEFQQSQGISNYALEKQLGVSNGYMNKCKNPSSDFVVALLGKYSMLSAEWLMRGEGQMLRNVSATPTPHQAVSYMAADNHTMQRDLTNETLKRLIDERIAAALGLNETKKQA